MVILRSCTIRLILLVLFSVATGEEPDAISNSQQITTITTSSSEPCSFNRFCTCVTENIQSVVQPTAFNSNLETNVTEELINLLNIDQKTNSFYSHSKLHEITCLGAPFYAVPKLPAGHIYRINIIGSKELLKIKSFSFPQTQISSIIITRSKVQTIDNDAFRGSESTLTALDLSSNELTEFPSSSLTRLPILQWLSLKGNRIEEIRANDLFPQQNNFLTKDYKYRVKRNSEKKHKILKKEDWIELKNEKDVNINDQVLLERTSRKRHNHHRHIKHKFNKIRSNKLSNKKREISQENYQMDDAHQVSKEYTTEDNYFQNQNETFNDHGVVSLRSLILSDNFLTTITSQTFTSLTNLESLDLDNNLINKIEGKTFPILLGSLSLANNLLEKFPTLSLKPLKQLKWLQLRGNMLKNLPEEWPFTFYNLEILDLSHNLISNLNSLFFQPINLNKHLGRSKMTLYAKNDFNKSSITGNQFISIKDLILDSNLLRSLPEDLFSFCEIERLVLSNNRLIMINTNLFSKSPLSESLRILDLSNNQLEKIDNILLGLNKLQSFFIRNNFINEIEETTFKTCAESLQILDLSGNRLQKIPSNAFEPIKRLYKLNLQDNQIKFLKKSDFQQWSKSLLSLLLSKNRIELIERDTFKFCTNLRELRLASNYLYNINPEIFLPLARKLSILELSSLENKPTNLSNTISESLNKLKNIEFLELNHNNLDKISSTALSNLTNLVHLDLEGNNIEELNANFFNSSKHSKLRNIILTDNKIENLNSFTFSNLKQLINIALIGNKLKTIKSNTFNNLPQLSTILLTKNKLKSLEPNSFNNIKNLRNLFIQHNFIKELSLDIFNLTDNIIRNKNILNDESINIDQLNQQFKIGTQQPFTGLNLNISYNNINYLNSFKYSNYSPDEDYNLNLSILDLSFNKLTKINSEFFKPISKSLLKLYINNNHLIDFPIKSLKFCYNLQLLSLTNNNIQDFNEINITTNWFYNLQFLDLSNNQLMNLSKLKKFFFYTKNLIHLNLSFNKINTIPDELFNKTSLQSLDLSSNQIIDLPFTIDCYGLKDSLVKLKLDNNLLTILPKELNTCLNLLHLSIKSNQLTEIGNEAFKMTNLLKLDLSLNTFYSIQNEAFDKLTNLRKLVLKSCKLDSIPILNNCLNLNELDLSNNSITLNSLQQATNALTNSNGLLKCRKLKILNLSSNLLNEVPRQFWKYLNSLIELDISSNPIELLDSSSLAELKRLRIIDIRNLQLKYVDPRVFYNHKHLTYIKTSTYPNVRSFRLYDLLAKMFSVRRAVINVEESILSHQIQWAFGSKIKELTITGSNLIKILPDAFLGLHHTSDFVLRITKTSITQLPKGLLRYLNDLKYVTLDLSENNLTSFDENVIDFESEKSTTKKNILTGGLFIQKNKLKCDCNLLWLKSWLKNWLKELRKAQLINHEHYLRNYLNVEQVKCLKESRQCETNDLNDQVIKLDFLKILPNKIETLNQNITNDEFSIINLNKNELKCSNTIELQLKYFLLYFNIIYHIWFLYQFL